MIKGAASTELKRLPRREAPAGQERRSSPLACRSGLWPALLYAANFALANRFRLTPCSAAVRATLAAHPLQKFFDAGHDGKNGAPIDTTCQRRRHANSVKMARILRGVEQSNLSSCCNWRFANNCG